MGAGRIKVTAPFSDSAIRSLAAGDALSVSGVLYTARDAAHKRLVEMASRGEKMPFEFNGAAVYYVGPTPARPGAVIGSAGPTTSGRMDAYSPTLMALGLRVMIGKGLRHAEVTRAMIEYGGLYLAAVGGAALGARVVPEAFRGIFPAGSLGEDKFYANI